MPSAGGGFLNKLKALDAYPKINEDFFTKTFSGGIITIVASVVMGLLFLSELSKCCISLMMALASCNLALLQALKWLMQCLPAGLFLSGKTVHELSVDVARGERISINVST